MSIHYNVPGKKRKELVDEIARWLGTEAKYLGVPSCAYEVGFATIDKNGNFTVKETADEETVERLIEHLDDMGFESDINTDSDSDDNTEARICVSLPETYLPKEAEENLLAIVTSKYELFKKAFGVDTFPIDHEDGKVSFPWFAYTTDPIEINAYSKFVCAICEMARNQKRVTAKEKGIDNEKYAFRCFLLRLGFIGDEYKSARKILLRNLSGSGAFKSGNPKVQELIERINADADLYDDVMSLQDKEVADNE